MGKNTVLKTTKKLLKKPKHVTINDAALMYLAERFAKEEIGVPNWHKLPVLLGANEESTIDFLLLGNAINFAYTDFSSGEKFCSDYLGMEWRGAAGMWACLKKEWWTNQDILRGDYLSEISEAKMKEIFKGSIEIPMLKERLQIFREVGRALSEKYDNYFHNLVEASNGKLFNKGKGLVERLVKDFPSFDDSVDYKGKKRRFDKRAQLGPAMIYAWFKEPGTFYFNKAEDKWLKKEGKSYFNDVGELTVFADYVLPKGLRDLGVLVYEKSLAERVDNQKLIGKGSQEELEIRASTIHACDRLVKKINKIKGSDKINALCLDAKLWLESRRTKSSHHLTITSAY